MGKLRRINATKGTFCAKQQIYPQGANMTYEEAIKLREDETNGKLCADSV